MKRGMVLTMALVVCIIMLAAGCSDPTPATAQTDPLVRKDDAILYGLNFSPYTDESQNPEKGSKLDEGQVRNALQAIAPCTRWVRTYGCSGGLEHAGRLAHEMGLKIAAGAWLGSDHAANELQIENLIRMANEKEADVLIVGSETLLRGDLTEDQLIQYIRTVREGTKGLPITTAERWDVYLQHPNLIQAVDTLYANFYPYWDGVNVLNAIGSLDSQYKQLKKAAGGKAVAVAETGWPDSGDTVKEAVPNAINACIYFGNFASWAKTNHVPYFYFEAFDEPWKGNAGTPQEAHWGLWDSKMEMKPLIKEVWSEAQGAYKTPVQPGKTTTATPSPLPSPTISPAPAPDLPDLSVVDITARFGWYGGMGIEGKKDSDTFTMILGNGSWASVGIDVDVKGVKQDLSGYRYAIIRAKGANGGEEFRFGLGVGPTDYHFKKGLSKEWQDIVVDISKSRRDLKNVFQVGFEIGPSWTGNTQGTRIHIDGIRFTNHLPEGAYVQLE